MQSGDRKDPRSHPILPTEATKRRIHHRHSPQSVAVSLANRLIVKNAVRAWAFQPNLHWPLEYLDGLAGLLPRIRSAARIDPVRPEHCTAEWVRAPGASSSRAILYLHGGAFLTCGLNTHRSLVTRLSKAADAAVLTIGYRKLPAHRHHRCDRRRPVRAALAAAERLRRRSSGRGGAAIWPS